MREITEKDVIDFMSDMALPDPVAPRYISNNMAPPGPMLLTAKMARMIATAPRAGTDAQTPQQNVEAVLRLVDSAARVGKTSLNMHGEFWANGGYLMTDAYKEAKEMLQGLGYTVTFFYQARQFVDMYTVISW